MQRKKSQQKIKKQNKDYFTKLEEVYNLLNNYFKDLKWWPGETKFEVIVGAILTQNTTWKNVEKVIIQLKQNNLLLPKNILELDIQKLHNYVRSAGYYKAKSETLKKVSLFLLKETNGNIKKLQKYDTNILRKKLLNIKGIGPETADSILLYALDKPIFVVDAYTKRLFLRHQLIKEQFKYNEIQTFVHNNFPKELSIFKQFHALIVEGCKNFCKKKDPLCDKCPLKKVMEKQVS